MELERAHPLFDQPVDVLIEKDGNVISKRLIIRIITNSSKTRFFTEVSRSCFPVTQVIFLCSVNR